MEVKEDIGQLKKKRWQSRNLAQISLTSGVTDGRVFGPGMVRIHVPSCEFALCRLAGLYMCPVIGSNRLILTKINALVGW